MLVFVAVFVVAQVLVSLAHAAVTAEHNKSGKKWSRERLSAQLEEGAEILKSVFSCVSLLATGSSDAADGMGTSSEIPSYDLVVPALLDKGMSHLQEACSLTPGALFILIPSLNRH